MTIFMLIGMATVIILEMSHGRISLNLVLLLLLVNCEWAQVEIDVYIPHHKYQVKPPSFPAACGAPIVHRIIFFICTYKINLLNLKYSSNRLVIIVKVFLKLPNLHMLMKQKSLSLPKNLALRIFGELLIVFLAKVNLL